MYGSVGTGKSTIARTIAKKLEEQDDTSFGASFFFRRTEHDQNDPSRLIATIAYQLAERMPQLKKRIAIALASEERIIFSRSYKDQIATLITRPLTEAESANFPSFEVLLGLMSGLLTKLTNYFSSTDKPNERRRRLVIIDGLDECGGLDHQLAILQVLFEASQGPNFPLFFLVTSRPEHGIRTFFNRNSVYSLSRRLVLDNEQYKLNKDIKAFFDSEFNDIRTDHPSGISLPQDWPHELEIEQLLQKASGQFLYAATVMKFIRLTTARPQVQLQIVLGATPRDQDTLFTDLDGLYISIFKSACDSQSKPAESYYSRVLEIFAFLILTGTDSLLTVDNVECFLCYEEGELRILFANLHSIVNVPSDNGDSNIHIYHASLRDFLLDKGRAEHLFIDAVKGHASLAKQCIKHLSSSYDPCKFQAYFYDRKLTPSSKSWPFQQ